MHSVGNPLCTHRNAVHHPNDIRVHSPNCIFPNSVTRAASLGLELRGKVGGGWGREGGDVLHTKCAA